MRRRDYLWAAVVVALLLGWLTDRSLRGAGGGSPDAAGAGVVDEVVGTAQITEGPASVTVRPVRQVVRTANGTTSTTVRYRTLTNFIAAENRRDP